MPPLAEGRQKAARSDACPDPGDPGESISREGPQACIRGIQKGLEAAHYIQGAVQFLPSLSKLRCFTELRWHMACSEELLDPDVWDFICKYNLDDRVMNRLIDTLNNRKNKRKETLQAADSVKHLLSCLLLHISTFRHVLPCAFSWKFKCRL